MFENVEAYDKPWDLAQHRFLHQPPLFNFLTQNIQELGLDCASTFVSIGTGTGMMDRDIIETCMPKLKSYIAVDPCKKLLGEAEKNISSIKRIQARFINSKLEEFDQPPGTVDVILMSHCMYYVYATLQHELERSFKWLTPGGVMIIAIGVEGEEEHPNLIPELREALDGYTADNLESGSSQIEAYLKKLNMPYSDTYVSMDVLIHPGEGLKELLHICLNKEPNPREFEISLKVMRKYCQPGSDHCPIGQKVFVVRKQ